MNYNFRKIYAKDSLFIATKSQLQEELEEFQSFAEKLTIKSGKSKVNKSGKANSYTDYLVRLIIIHQEIEGKIIDSILSFSTLSELKKVVNSNEF